MNRFWQHKTLNEMTPDEWESLCDGCGKCCLIKLQDDDTDEVFYTDVACRLLNKETCRCQHYEARKKLQPACIKLKREDVDNFDWLPETCAYRLLSKGMSLPHWHHLVCGDKKTIHQRGHSVAYKVVSELDVDDDSLQARIVKWVN